MNTMCAAGTGSFLDQQSHRLQLTIEQFSEIALKSENPPRLAGRCSVFAKSDMIHLQQEATPDYDIVAGLCFAMARNLKSNIAKGKKVVPPVAFIGGVAANQGVHRALKEILDLEPDELLVPEDFGCVGALGAALFARDQGLDRANGRPGGPGAPGRGNGRRDQAPAPAQAGPASQAGPPDGPGARRAADRLPGGGRGLHLHQRGGHRPGQRGLVQGSTCSPPAAPGGGQGRPQAGGRSRSATGWTILGAGTTGSGRYLTADFIGADIVRNEITAQATAAAHIDPEVDTIFEIGGQDSKYISLENGAIVDFMMNKVCAAGTGSFLEEQAEKLGIADQGRVRGQGPGRAQAGAHGRALHRVHGERTWCPTRRPGPRSTTWWPG